MYRETTHLNFKLNLAQQLIISSLPQTSVRFFGFKKVTPHLGEFPSASGIGKGGYSSQDLSVLPMRTLHRMGQAGRYRQPVSLDTTAPFSTSGCRRISRSLSLGQMGYWTTFSYDLYTVIHSTSFHYCTFNLSNTIHATSPMCSSIVLL